MSEQDGKIVNLGGLKKFKEYYDTDIITPINNKINSKTNVQSGETITTNNDTIGYFKNIKIKGNTRYKKSDGTYTDTWESGVSLESMGEKEKDSNGKYPIEVVSCGKNLAFTATSSGNVKLNTIVDTNKLVVGKQYVISAKHIDTTKKVHMCSYKSDGTKVSNTYDASSPLKFTDSKDIDNITFSTEDVWTWCNVIDIQLEKGTTATTYEAYKEDKRTVLLDSPLRKNDVLDLEKLKITRNYGSATFNGEEEWAIGVEHTNTILFDKTLGNSKPNYIMCDKFIYNTSIWGVDTEGCRISNNGSIQINISKSKLETQDVAGFKKWLQSNPVTVVYQLATPITEDMQVSPTDNPLTSYTPSTTLTTNNNIKGNISADMPTNLSGVITQQASLIAQLEDNLLQTQALLIDNVIDNT